VSFSADLAIASMFHRGYFQTSFFDGNTVMTKNSFPVALLSSVIVILFANAAGASPGSYAGDSLFTVRYLSSVERTQYYSFGNNDYCWYDDGWQGPGWYSCGDEWGNGFGWGGPYGWNGWGGGCRMRQHGSHGIGVWRQGPPNHAYGGVGHAAALNPGPYPGSHDGGAAVSHDIGGPGAGFHGLGSGDVPAGPRFLADAPAFHGVGGAEGFHGFGGGGGFRGGGGAFSSGGHGGGGHR
jgi:hypothetical protein